jgi:hypothetical protein
MNDNISNGTLDLTRERSTNKIYPSNYKQDFCWSNKKKPTCSDTVSLYKNTPTKGHPSYLARFQTGADPETLLMGGLSYGAIFSTIDGTNCSPKAVLTCRSVNLVFILFRV